MTLGVIDDGFIKNSLDVKIGPEATEAVNKGLEKVDEVLEKAPTFHELLVMFGVEETQRMAELRGKIVEYSKNWVPLKEGETFNYDDEDYLEMRKNEDELDKLLKISFTDETIISLYNANMFYQKGSIFRFGEEIKDEDGLINDMKFYHKHLDKIAYIESWYEESVKLYINSEEFDLEIGNLLKIFEEDQTEYNYNKVMKQIETYESFDISTAKFNDRIAKMKLENLIIIAEKDTTEKNYDEVRKQVKKCEDCGINTTYLNERIGNLQDKIQN